MKVIFSAVRCAKLGIHQLQYVSWTNWCHKRTVCALLPDRKKTHFNSECESSHAMENDCVTYAHFGPGSTSFLQRWFTVDLAEICPFIRALISLMFVPLIVIG